jgi:triacylglycerol esterase/lipase EstA (alpha/beta hydrolase family)
MGGLVASYLLKVIDRGQRVGTVITLGTPHRGTPFALAGARLLGRLGPSLAQMAPGSRFLEALERKAVPEGSALFSLAGLADLVVPAPCARLPQRARHHNRCLAAADHWDLVYGAAAQESVVRLLRERRRAPRQRRIEDARARLRVVQ